MRSWSPGASAFHAALTAPGTFNVIAECKRRSPSKGVLRADYDPAAIARAYERGGRRGHLGPDRAHVLRRLARHILTRACARRDPALPLLRKDFVVDEFQCSKRVRARRDADPAHRRGAVDERARPVDRPAERDGLAALVEVHDGDELERALDGGRDDRRGEQPQPADARGLARRPLRTRGAASPRRVRRRRRERPADRRGSARAASALATTRS